MATPFQRCQMQSESGAPPFQKSMLNKNGLDRALEESECERDPGVMIDNKLKFATHVDTAVAKANKLLGVLCRTMTYLDTNTLSLLYKSLIRPHLEYANVAWQLLLKKDMKKIEDVQRRTTRLIPALRKMEYCYGC